MRALFEDARSRIIALSPSLQFQRLHKEEYIAKIILGPSHRLKIIPSFLGEKWLERIPHPWMLEKLNKEYIKCEQYEALLNFFIDYSFLYPELSGDSDQCKQRIKTYQIELEKVYAAMCFLSAQVDKYRSSFDVSSLEIRPYHPSCSPPAKGPFLGQEIERAG